MIPVILAVLASLCLVASLVPLLPFAHGMVRSFDFGRLQAIGVAALVIATALIAGEMTPVVLAAIAMAGLPPLSGFIGKLLILDAAFEGNMAVWIWVVVLGSSLISIVGFSRAGSTLFWKAKSIPHPEGTIPEPAPAALSYVAVGGLLTLLVAHTVFAGPAYSYVERTAAQLFEPEPYVATVLETPGKLSKPSKEEH